MSVDVVIDLAPCPSLRSCGIRLSVPGEGHHERSRRIGASTRGEIPALHTRRQAGGSWRLRHVWLLVIALGVPRLIPNRSWAEDLAVPPRVQAELVGKLAPYDRNFLERAGGRVTIAIVTKLSDVDSARAASQMQIAFNQLGPIGGLPHHEVVVPWKDARDLLDRCVKERFAVVYLTPGLGSDIGGVAKELEGKNVLTVGGVLTYVVRGAVLGFELVSGHTKLVVNLDQAKKQGVMFRSEVLKLMRIVK